MRVVIRPMIGDWTVPAIERIATVEARRLARLPVPGLKGDLHQDLGVSSLVVEISGSLHGDQARDDLVNALRPPYLAGDPVAFVADIVTATELEQVLIEQLEIEESNTAGGVHYRIRLRQYVEPPEPPAPLDDPSPDLDAGLAALADLGLDGLDLPDVLGDIPTLTDMTPPIRDVLTGVKSATEPLGAALGRLSTALTA
jgi:hypothetical protein